MPSSTALGACEGDPGGRFLGPGRMPMVIVFDFSLWHTFAVKPVMDNWFDLVATLGWRGLSISPDDYLELVRVGEFSAHPERWVDHVPVEKVRLWLRNNPDWWERGKRELDWCRQNKVSWVRLGEEGYPSGLMALEKPPLLLSYWGHPCWQEQELLAIVGSRRPSKEALGWLEFELPQLLLKQPNLAIVSGGARGVDQKAHALAIRSHRPTLVFLPSGLSQIYPSTLTQWVSAVQKSGGAMISPFSPFMSMYNGNFHYRNRLIAAISQLVFVVQARRRSGTMITARAALECDRAIATLPFFPGADGAQGNLDLIVDGSQIIRDHGDLLTALGQRIR